MCSWNQVLLFKLSNTVIQIYSVAALEVILYRILRQAGNVCHRCSNIFSLQIVKLSYIQIRKTKTRKKRLLSFENVTVKNYSVSSFLILSFFNYSDLFTTFIRIN